MVSQVILLIAFAGFAAAHYPGVVEPVYHHAPQPYKFGYDIKDSHGNQYRHEEGTGGNSVKGSYGFTDARGVHRHVNYVADHAGFRAQVNTNEPGTANQNPAAVQINSDAHYAGAVGGLGYGGYGDYGVNQGYGGYGGYGDYGAYQGYGGYGLGGYGGYGLGGFGYGVPALGYARYGY